MIKSSELIKAICKETGIKLDNTNIKQSRFSKKQLKELLLYIELKNAKLKSFEKGIANAIK